MRKRPQVAGGLCVAAIALALQASCAMRVGAGGPPGDPPSPCWLVGAETKLPFGAGSQSFAFRWSGNHYVVAYSDPSKGSGDIYVAKLAADGSTVGSPAPVESTPAASDLPALVATSGGFLVAWQEGTAGESVLAHALSSDAEPVGSGVAIAATQSNQSRPVLAPAPEGKVAAAWMDDVDGKGGVQVALVDPASMDVTGPVRVAPHDVDGWPWLAGDGSHLALAWCDAPGSGYDVDFAMLGEAPLGPSQAESLRGSAPGQGLLPRLVRTDRGFLAAWEDMRSSGENQIFAEATDASGHLLGGGLVEEQGSGDANWPNMAWTGTSAAVVYYQWRGGRPQIYLTLVDALGARFGGADLQVSRGGRGWSRYPDVVWNGRELGVIYVDDRDGAPALWFQRVSCSG